MPASHEHWARLLAPEPLPAAVVDLDALDRNLVALTQAMGESRATLRIATKSVRCPWVLRYLLHRGQPRLVGLMTWSARETELLAELGFDDLLLAYPASRPAEARGLAALVARGTRVGCVVDCEEHVDLLAGAAATAGVTMELVLDVDLSWQPAPGLYFGVRRSPLRDATAVVALARKVADTAGVRLGGIMAYEAQVAGVADRNPTSRSLDPLRRFVKGRSRPLALDRRRAVTDALRETGHALPLVNGGGTGSIRSTSADPTVTEVTAGSGFYCPHLFDGYDGLHLSPALFVALAVARRPDPEHLTCAGGGVIASGPPGPDRAPVVHLPAGLEPLSLEGWGEVQTPFRNRGGTALAVGDPVICRPAKAGEPLEHFTEVLLVRGDTIEDRAPTYRGLGL